MAIVLSAQSIASGNPYKKIEYGKTMFKYKHKMLPPAFDNYFKQPSHLHKTRFVDLNNFSVVLLNNAKEKSLLKYMGTTVWRKIPVNIRNSMSLKVFVKLFRNHLIGTFEDSLKLF